MSFTDATKRAIATVWDLVPKRPALTVLYYHAVRADQAAAFEAQMALLRRTANIVPADHTGPLDRDRPNVAVTFDDAFRSVREHALPAGTVRRTSTAHARIDVSRR